MLWLPASQKVRITTNFLPLTHFLLCQTRSGHIFAEFYQSPTFSILAPLAAAVRAESDDQEDAEPHDSEPYLDASDSDASMASLYPSDGEPEQPPPSPRSSLDPRPRSA